MSLLVIFCNFFKILKHFLRLISRCAGTARPMIKSKNARKIKQIQKNINKLTECVLLFYVPLEVKWLRSAVLGKVEAEVPVGYCQFQNPKCHIGDGALSRFKHRISNLYISTFLSLLYFFKLFQS